MLVVAKISVTASASAKSISDSVSLNAAASAIEASSPLAPPPADSIIVATLTPATYKSVFEEAIGSVVVKSVVGSKPSPTFTASSAATAVKPSSIRCCTSVVTGVMTVEPTGAVKTLVKASPDAISTAPSTVPSTIICFSKFPPRLKLPFISVNVFGSSESNIPLSFSSLKTNALLMYPSITRPTETG